MNSSRILLLLFLPFHKKLTHFLGIFLWIVVIHPCMDDARLCPYLLVTWLGKIKFMHHLRRNISVTHTMDKEHRLSGALDLFNSRSLLEVPPITKLAHHIGNVEERKRLKMIVMTYDKRELVPYARVATVLNVAMEEVRLVRFA